MKLGQKIPYGVPVIIAAAIFALTALSLSPDINTNGGYEALAGPVFKIIAIAVAVAAGVAGILFLVNSFAVENQLEKAERERAEKLGIEAANRRKYDQEIKRKPENDDGFIN